MRLLLIVVAAALTLAGCTTTSFFGSGSPCEKAALIHAGFATAAAVTPSIPPSAIKAERTLYAGVATACASGSDLKSVNLVQLVNTYVAAVEEYRRQ